MRCIGPDGQRTARRRSAAPTPWTLATGTGERSRDATPRACARWTTRSILVQTPATIYDAIPPLPPRTEREAEFYTLGDGEMLVNLGPQHPSTHGVLRVVLKIDGERIVDLDPVLGYLHRGVEKICENGDWHHAISNCDPLEYIASMFSEALPVLTAEKLLGLEVPRRAEYIRVLAWELNRISSHALFIGWLALDLGGLTPILYGFIERDEIVEMLAALTGQKLLFNYLRIGGVNGDLNHEFLSRLGDWMGRAGKHIDEQAALLNENEIFVNRTKGLGRIDRADGSAPVHVAVRRCARRACPTTCGARTPTASTRSSSSTSRRAPTAIPMRATCCTSRRSSSRCASSTRSSTRCPTDRSWPSCRASCACRPGRAFVALESPRGQYAALRHQRRLGPALPLPHPRPLVLQPAGRRAC